MLGRSSLLRHGRAALIVILLGAAAGAGAGCSVPVDTRGALPEDKLVQQVRPGLHRREDVQALLGSPSTMATFSDNKWYYIGKKTKRLAFFKPEVVEQQVLVVTFDDQGTVKDIQRYDKGDARSVSMVGRETPTSGHEMTILQQLLGNIGKYTGEKEE